MKGPFKLLLLLFAVFFIASASALDDCNKDKDCEGANRCGEYKFTHSDNTIGTGHACVPSSYCGHVHFVDGHNGKITCQVTTFWTFSLIVGGIILAFCVFGALYRKRKLDKYKRAKA